MKNYDLNNKTEFRVVVKPKHSQGNVDRFDTVIKGKEGDDAFSILSSTAMKEFMDRNFKGGYYAVDISIYPVDRAT